MAPRPQITRTKISRSSDRLVFEICQRTDRPTHIDAHRITSHPSRGRSNKRNQLKMRNACKCMYAKGLKVRDITEKSSATARMADNGVAMGHTSPPGRSPFLAAHPHPRLKSNKKYLPTILTPKASIWTFCHNTPTSHKRTTRGKTEPLPSFSC